VTGSFISLSHAIKRDGALRCQDCHGAESVLDFKALSYSAPRIARLQSLLTTFQVLESARTPEGNLRVRWSARPKRAYQLMMSSDLEPGSWKPMGDLRGDVKSGTSLWYESVVPASAIANKTLFFQVREIAP
jgi:hypothetical protein